MVSGFLGCAGSPSDIFSQRTSIGDRYDWTTGGLNDVNEWRNYRVVPHVHPSRPFVVLILRGLEAEGVSDFQGRRGITSVARRSDPVPIPVEGTRLENVKF